MAEICEVIMMISFGISWPISIFKSLTSKTAKGKSILFSYFIIFGYLCGLLGKFISGNITYVIFFYIINIVMVSIDAMLYYRNKKLDEIRDAK